MLNPVSYTHLDVYKRQDKEVQEMLKYFDLSEHYADVKEWYDGYHFGNANVYCCLSLIHIYAPRLIGFVKALKHLGHIYIIRIFYII